MDEIREKQYANLRQCFYALVDAILGPMYYNEAMDVYSADNNCCRDIANKFGREKQYQAYLSVRRASHKLRSVKHVIGEKG